MSSAPTKISFVARPDQDGNALFVDVYAIFEVGGEAERDAWIAQFPKALKVKASTMGTVEGTNNPIARFGVDLRSNGVSGVVNETGVKRFLKFVGIVGAENLKHNERYSLTAAAVIAQVS